MVYQGLTNEFYVSVEMSTHTQLQHLPPIPSLHLSSADTHTHTESETDYLGLFLW